MIIDIYGSNKVRECQGREMKVNFLETTCLNLRLRSEINLEQELKWRRSRTNI